MWKARLVHLLRSAGELSLREPFVAQQQRNMAAVSAMQPHMRKAVAEISHRMRSVDLVIEMRDARIPHTSANYNLINIIRGKPKRLLLLNKADLAHKRFRKETLLELESANQKVLFTCTSSQNFAAEVLAAVRMCLPSAETSLEGVSNTRPSSSRAANGRVHVVMVVGTPNVGKTSLINALRRHARTQGLLDVPRAGQLPVGPLPGVTKHVSGIKVSDNPTMLLIDTPGVMLPRLTASLFAYRVALAGLVQETNVQLSELFAFTLYVLAQSPNKSQLKAVLAEPLPDPGAPDGSKPAAGTQATIRWAYASKRFAKCALQAIDEVLEVHSQHSMANDGAADVWSRHHRSCDDVSDSEVGPGDRLLNQRSIGAVRDRQHGHGSALQQLRSSKRPRLAGEYLALLQSRGDPGSNSTMRDARSVDPVKCTAGADTVEQPPCMGASGAKNMWRHRAPLSGVWGHFDDRLWSACGELLLRKLIKPSMPHGRWEPPAEVLNVAMERLVRLVRAGHLGKLVFEEPRPKPEKGPRAGGALRAAPAAASPTPTGHVAGVN